MVNKPTDLSVNQPVKKKAEEPKRPNDAIQQRETTAQQGAGAKLQMAALSPVKAIQGSWQDAVNSFNKARTDLVLGAAGYKADDIVNKLSPKTVAELARGKQLQDQVAADPSLKLTPSQQGVVNEYRQYHDKVVGDGLSSNGLAAISLDHNAMIAELNDSIAKRYKAENPSAPPEVPGKNPEPPSKNTTDSAEPRRQSPSTSQSKSESESQSNNSQSRVPGGRTDASRANTSSPADNHQSTGHVDSATASQNRAEARTRSEASGIDRQSPSVQRVPADHVSNSDHASSSDHAFNSSSTATSTNSSHHQTTKSPSDMARPASLQSQQGVETQSGRSTGAHKSGDSLPSTDNARTAPTSKTKQEAQTESPTVKTAGLASLSESRSHDAIRPQSTDSVRQPSGDSTKQQQSTRALDRLPSEGTNSAKKDALLNDLNNHAVARLTGGNETVTGQRSRIEDSATARLRNEHNESLPAPRTAGANRETSSLSKESRIPEGQLSGSNKSALSQDNVHRPTVPTESATAARNVRTTEQSTLMRAGIQKIESAHELVQTLKSGASSMVRPLILGAASGRGGENIILSVRSTVAAQGIQTNKRANIESSPILSRPTVTDIANKSNQMPKAGSDQSRRIANPSAQVSGQRPFRFEPSGYANRGNSADNAAGGKPVLATTFRVVPEPKRQLLGTEIALTMILASAGIQRLRADQARSQRGDATTVASNEPAKVSRAEDSSVRTARENVASRLNGVNLSTRIEVDKQARAVKQQELTQKNTQPIDQTKAPHISGWMDGRQSARVGFHVDGRREPLSIQPSLSTRAGQFTGQKGRSNSSSLEISGTQRHTFGTEIALATLLASGGISRLRADKRLDAAKAGLDLATGKPAEKSKTNRVSNIEVTKDPNSISPEKHKIGYQSWSFQSESSKEKFLAKLKEQIRIPESLKQQCDLLVRRITNAPVPIYSTGHDDSQSIGVWYGRSLPEVEVLGASPQVKTNPLQKFQKALGEKFLQTISEDEGGSIGLDDDEIPNTAAQFSLKRPTVLVALNDTLVSIAETFFHDPNLAWLIIDLNRNSIRQTEIEGKRVVELQTRQKLLLPVWEPDIADFYADSDRQHEPIEKLVTIVEETQIDKELMSSILGSVVGEKKQIDTNRKNKTDDFQLINTDRKSTSGLP